MVRDLKPAPGRFGQVPKDRGLIVACLSCNRPYAISRDTALKAWGERGNIREVCAKLRCRNCRRVGCSVALAPHKAKLGSPADFDKLVEAIRAVRPSRTIG